MSPTGLRPQLNDMAGCGYMRTVDNNDDLIMTGSPGQDHKLCGNSRVYSCHLMKKMYKESNIWFILR